MVGTDEKRREAFRSALLILTRRIELMLCLPLEKLDRLVLQDKLSGIGTS